MYDGLKGMAISFRALAAAVLAGLTILAAGCSTTGSPVALAGTVPGASLHPNGPFPGVRYRDGGTAALESAPPPASSALPGANDLLTVGTTGATVLAAADSGIWRSTDGGRSWLQVLGGIRAWSVTAVPGGGYAALGDLPLPAGASGMGAPELATSANGISWRMEKVAASGSTSTSPFPFGYGYRFVLSGFGAGAWGVAVPDSGWFSGGPSAYRTTDGGRTWTPISLPGVSGGLAMAPGGRAVLATGSGSGRGCEGAVYRSSDGGASWTLLPGSCQPYPLFAVQFVSASLGFAAGGEPAQAGGEQFVEATTDGGQTWQARWRTTIENGPNADGAILWLDMVTASQGWAATGGCSTGQNGPCPGTVYVTSDGGYQWQRTSHSAIAVVGLGAGRALAADDRAQTAALTSDGGRTWAVQTRPATISTSAFAGAGSTQFWATNLGDFISKDGGTQWAGANQPAVSQFTGLSWLAAPPARLLGYSQNGGYATWSSSNGGQSWITATVPADTSADSPDQIIAIALGSGDTATAVTGPGAQCLSSAQITKVEKLKHGWKPPAGASVLYTSTTGGTQWDPTGLVLPFGVGFGAPTAVSGSRIAIIDACGRLELSDDGGVHWSAQALGSGQSCTVSVLAAEIWLACVNTNANGATWVLHSADGGSTWLAYRLPATANAPYGIFATGPDAAVMPVGGSLWRTANGGKTWTQSWPAL